MRPINRGSVSNATLTAEERKQAFLDGRMIAI